MYGSKNPIGKMAAGAGKAVGKLKPAAPRPLAAGAGKAVGKLKPAAPRLTAGAGKAVGKLKPAAPKLARGAKKMTQGQAMAKGIERAMDKFRK